MSERFPWRYQVPHPLLEFSDIRKTTLLLAGPYALVAYAHDENSADSRDKRHAAEIILESGKEFLRHPGGTQQPAALTTVFNFNSRKIHAHPPAYTPQNQCECLSAGPILVRVVFPQQLSVLVRDLKVFRHIEAVRLTVSRIQFPGDRLVSGHLVGVLVVHDYPLSAAGMSPAANRYAPAWFEGQGRMPFQRLFRKCMKGDPDAAPVFGHDTSIWISAGARSFERCHVRADPERRRPPAKGARSLMGPGDH
jgi:hypothetical protein